MIMFLFLFLFFLIILKQIEKDRTSDTSFEHSGTFFKSLRNNVVKLAESTENTLLETIVKCVLVVNSYFKNRIDSLRIDSSMHMIGQPNIQSLPVDHWVQFTRWLTTSRFLAENESL